MVSSWLRLTCGDQQITSCTRLLRPSGHLDTGMTDWGRGVTTRVSREAVEGTTIVSASSSLPIDFFLSKIIMPSKIFFFAFYLIFPAEQRQAQDGRAVAAASWAQTDIMLVMKQISVPHSPVIVHRQDGRGRWQGASSEADAKLYLPADGLQSRMGRQAAAS